jgi:hypothetical protein
MNIKPISTKLLRSFALVFALAALFGISGRVFAQTAMPSVCVAPLALSQDLYIGEYDAYTGGQVTTLQNYLYTNGYMTHIPTGYFGPITMQGVISFQRSHGVIATGYFGPLSRAALPIGCGQTSPITISSITPSSAPVGTTVTISGSGFTSFATNTIHFGSGAIANVAPNTLSCPYPSFAACYDSHTITFTIPSSVAPYCAPGMMCAMYMQLVTPGTYPVYVTNANGTSNTANFTVVGTSSNSVSITSLDAPSAMTISNQGTWTVHATTNGSSNLHYAVVWGDESNMYGSNAIVASPTSSLQSSATFTHTYTQAGTYTPTFTVTDDFGHSATTSATVRVNPIY